MDETSSSTPDAVELSSESSGLLRPGDPPDDKGHLAYWTFFFLGAGFLLPWNAFITAIDYFSLLYPSQHVDSVFPVAYVMPTLVLLVALVAYGERNTSRARVSGGFMAFFLLVLAVPVLDRVMIRGERGTPASFAVTVGLVAAAGLIDGLIQGSLFGMAADLPPRFTQALVAGTAASGLLVSVLRLATKGVLPGDDQGLQWSAYSYFGLAAAMLFLCVVAFHRLFSLPIMKHGLQRRASFQSVRSDSKQQEVGTEPLASDPASTPIGWEEAGVVASGGCGPSTAACTSGLSRADVRAESLWAFGKAMALKAVPRTDRFRVLSHMWPYAAAVTGIYVVTLGIFPGFIAELHAGALGSWYPVLLITIFNLLDFVGKMSPAFVAGVEDRSALCALSCARLLFFPLYALCVRWGSSAAITLVLLPALTALLGFSNGFLTSLLMMAAPAAVPPAEADAAGTVMVLFLVLGLALGSAAAWLWLLL